MKKRYTLMIFDENKFEAVKTRKVSLRTIKFVFFLLSLYVMVSIAGFYFLNNLISERNTMLVYKAENEQLKSQISGYASQLNTIREKIASVDELEYKVRNLATYQKQKPAGIKQMAIGGREVDVLQDLSALSERKEKEFFEELNNTLSALNVELEKRSVSLSELADYLEEQKLLMASTPSIWPAKGWISSSFGYRVSPFTGRRVFHEGLDIANKYSMPIRSAAKGIVIFSGTKAGYGYMVTIDHGYGYITRYAHCSELHVKVGQKIEKGQVIAKIGNTGRSTGPHLHYEVRVNGIPVNPLKFIVGETEFN